MQENFYYWFVFLLGKGAYCSLDYSWWLAEKKIMEIPLESGKIRHQAAEVNSDGKLYILHY